MTTEDFDCTPLPIGVTQNLDEIPVTAAVASVRPAGCDRGRALDRLDSLPSGGVVGFSCADCGRRGTVSRPPQRKR